MGDFFSTILTLPTAFYTVLLGVVVGYWLLSAVGLAGGEMIDGWIGGDGHGHGAHGLGDHTLVDGAQHPQQLLAAFAVGEVASGEALALERLAAEGTHHPHAAQVLVQVARQLALGLVHRLELPARPPEEPDREDDDDRQDGGGNQRHA